MKRGACGCRNHKGTPKIKYPSLDAALSAIVKRNYVRNAGGASAYPCPNMAGVWHVRTGEKGKSRAVNRAPRSERKERR